MPPFNGHPEGFSVATLALLDEGLHRMWLEAQAASAAKSEATKAVRPALASGRKVTDPDKRD